MSRISKLVYRNQIVGCRLDSGESKGYNDSYSLGKVDINVKVAAKLGIDVKKLGPTVNLVDVPPEIEKRYNVFAASEKEIKLRDFVQDWSNDFEWAKNFYLSLGTYKV